MNKEDKDKKEDEIEDEDTGTDDASREDQDDESEDEDKEEDDSADDESEDEDESDDESDDESQNIDHKSELEKLEAGGKSKTELDKAKRALHFNAQRLLELGGDPAEVLKLKTESKKEDEETHDVSTEVSRQFAERDARAVSRSEDEYKLIMWYVNNRKLSVEEAYILANKGKMMRSISEAKRGNVEFGKPNASSKKKATIIIPKHPGADLLERRGMKFNPQTNTYQGKFYEEYYNPATRSWESRKLVKK